MRSARHEEYPMAKFVYVYTGGGMAETPEAQEEAMQAWGAWFASLGESMADPGNPFGGSATVSSTGVTDGGASKVGGYSIVSVARASKPNCAEPQSWPARSA
jgi:hypothetical protein